MITKSKFISTLTAIGFCFSILPKITALNLDSLLTLSANAASSYPVQEFRLAMADTDNNVTSSGSAIIPTEFSGTENEKWSLNYISSGVYEIVNSATGQILTANGNNVSLESDSNGTNQRWKIESVQKDFEGFDLYYKITSNADSSKSLTFTEGTGFGLSSYSGGIYQKYKINLDGLEGYAANAKVSGGEKAGTIGGLLGEVIYVSTVSDMVSAMKSEEPLTIVVSANLDFKDWSKEDQTIKSNKTIVGSYSAHELYDLQWRTDLFWGDSSVAPGNNIVFRNISVTSRTLNGKVMIQVYSSRNVWFDHITFNNTISYDRTGDGQDEVGKFIWINTPVANWSDGCYNKISPDYITISYVKLQNRYWTVAYGTQNTETTRCRTTVMYNDWEKCVRRTPQIGNGTGHIYNNYFEGYGDGSNGGGTAQIIGGDGSDILSENNRFQGFSKAQALSMGGGNDPAKDNGSYLSTSTNGTPSKISFSAKNTSSLNPGGELYGYTLIPSYTSNGNDTKKFCQTYAGAFSSKSDIKYITDADMSGWVEKSYKCPFLRHVDLETATAASFVNGSTYRIKNVNSGLYMQVEGAVAANGTNVQQWGTADGVTHDIWKLIDAGDGYYYIVSAVGDGGTYLLDVAGKKTANGTNVDIYNYNGGTNQQFMFTKNADGSYKILTRVSNNKSAVEIQDASTGSGANVQQWEINGHACQNWVLEEISNPGSKMDTNLIYEFENINSGMVMDIESGKMEENTNVQQWTTGHYKSQQWTLQNFGGGYYYIRSYSNPNYVLKAESGSNGGNIDIVPYSTNDSMMLFKFSKNPDGTYYIMTRSSKDACLVEVGYASKDSGANVQQWEPTNNDCQKWGIETFTTTTTIATTTTTTATTSSTSTTTAETSTTPVVTDISDTHIPSEEEMGDSNCDGAVGIADAVLILQSISNPDKYSLSAQGKLNADVVDNDGVTAKDALYIQMYEAGAIKSFK